MAEPERPAGSGGGVDKYCINCWSSPRCCSTSLMYAFAQRNDTQVLDEPLYGSFLSITGLARPYRDLVLQAQDTSAHRVSASILGKRNKPVLYAKHMAKHKIGLDQQLMQRATHMLLVREPYGVVQSFSKGLQPTLQELGYVAMLEIYSDLRAAGRPPIVVLSDELVRHPEGMLRSLCAVLELPFQPSMLHWAPGPKPYDGVWAPWWYANTHKSTGFDFSYRDSKEPLPDKLKPLLGECWPAFELLRTHALKPMPAEQIPRPLTHQRSGGQGLRLSMEENSSSRPSPRLSTQQTSSGQQAAAAGAAGGVGLASSSSMAAAEAAAAGSPSKADAAAGAVGGGTLTAEGSWMSSSGPPSGSAAAAAAAANGNADAAAGAAGVGCSSSSSATGTHVCVPDARNANVLVGIRDGTLDTFDLVWRPQARVSVLDSGFMLGDGVWEGIRLHKGVLAFAKPHLIRLYEGAKAIDMDIGATPKQLLSMIYATLDANGMGAASGVHIRLMISRGLKPTPYQNPKITLGKPTIVVLPEWKEAATGPKERGIRLFTVHIRRGPPDVQDPGWNSLSKLNCISACIQANKAGVDEGLMLDPQGFVATCNSVNFFIVREGEVWMPRGGYLMRGITRTNVIRLCRQEGLPLRECDFYLTQVYGADEAFATGTFAGLLPVVEVDGRRIGTGKRGPLTQQLQLLYAALVEADVAAGRDAAWDDDE